MANFTLNIADDDSASARRRWREPLLLAILLPAVIVAADTAMMNLCWSARWYGWPVFASYVLYVVQTAFLSTIVGRRLQHPVLKWVVFVWALLLVDFLIFPAALSGSTSRGCLAYAFFSGQVGILIVWGILGTSLWALRYPAALIGLVVITYFSAELKNEFWFPILSWQGVATAVFIGVVWFFGFRLRPPSPDDAGTDHRRMQFSMRHLFLWTTVVAVVVGLARIVDWTPLFYFERAPLFPMVALGACFTLISMIAIWSALGAESIYIRLALLVICAPLIALAVGAVGLTLRGPGWKNGWLADSLQIGTSFNLTLWITWMFLAAFFLSSTLMIFRASGYRLVRDQA